MELSIMLVSSPADCLLNSKLEIVSIYFLSNGNYIGIVKPKIMFLVLTKLSIKS
nr:hypothetical protein Itr_chr05CG19910 [Ipomoea trifida]